MSITPWTTDREKRKCGTDVPHKPTDEFVHRAFAWGAGQLWPDSRDPGWYVTFDRWLAARMADAWDEGYGDDAECNEPRTNPYRATEEPS